MQMRAIATAFNFEENCVKLTLEIVKVRELDSWNDTFAFWQPHQNSGMLNWWGFVVKVQQHHRMHG